MQERKNQRQALASMIVADVQSKFVPGASDPDNHLRKVGFGLTPVVTGAAVAMIPTLVQTTLDLVVRVGGPTVAGLVDEGHDSIRRFVSEHTLEFLAKVVRDLEDTKPQAAH